MFIDYQLHLLHALIRRHAPAVALAPIVSALEADYPGIVAAADGLSIETDPLVAALRTRLAGARPPATIWSGVGWAPLAPYVHVGASPSTRDKLAGAVRTPAFDALAPTVEHGPSAHLGRAYPVLTALEVLLVAAALERCPEIVPEDQPLDVRVEAGWQLGRLTHEGFVPTPLRIARASSIESRARAQAFLAERDGPEWDPQDHPVPASAFAAKRSLRHPDGRVWEIAESERGAELRAVDEDGDVFARTLDGLGPWEIEALVASQTREGFREI